VQIKVRLNVGYYLIFIYMKILYKRTKMAKHVCPTFTFTLTMLSVYMTCTQILYPAWKPHCFYTVYILIIKLNFITQKSTIVIIFYWNCLLLWLWQMTHFIVVELLYWLFSLVFSSQRCVQLFFIDSKMYKSNPFLELGIRVPLVLFFFIKI